MNLFAGIPGHLPEELFQTLVETEQIRVERIVSKGHSSPGDFWYDQPQAEWVVVLQGEASLRFEGENEPLMMQPGDYVLIPPHRRHRVEWTTEERPTVWLAIHFDGQSSIP